jgi:flavin reductase (DIM6/NTAB) family NADH-FMN oxidoreductase RutF
MSDYFYEPEKGHGLPHDPFLAIVGPRPIGWISTISEKGSVNLAPYSFFTAFSSRPPIIGFSSGAWKHSVQNANETGEFVANFASKIHSLAINDTSAPVAREVDEFAHAGLEPLPSRLVGPPRIKEAPAALECRVCQIVQLQDLSGNKIESWLTLGEVIGVHIDEEYLIDGSFDTASARPILRAGYRGLYADIGEIFEMIRPTA